MTNCPRCDVFVEEEAAACPSCGFEFLLASRPDRPRPSSHPGTPEFERAERRERGWELDEPVALRIPWARRLLWVVLGLGFLWLAFQARTWNVYTSLQRRFFPAPAAPPEEGEVSVEVLPQQEPAQPREKTRPSGSRRRASRPRKAF